MFRIYFSSPVSQLSNSQHHVTRYGRTTCSMYQSHSQCMWSPACSRKWSRPPSSSCLSPSQSDLYSSSCWRGSVIRSWQHKFTLSIFKFNCKVANDINTASHLSREIESKLGGCCRNDGGLVPPPHHHEILQPQQVLPVLVPLVLPLIVDVRQVDAAIEKLSVVEGVMPVLRRGNQI